MRYQDDPKIRAKYNCEKWKKVRKLKIQKANGLCEKCWREKRIFVEGKIVHHKIEITDQNYNNPELMYGLDNLELLCDDCHHKLHFNSDPYYFDEEGDLCGKESSYSSTTSRYKEIV